MGKTVRMIKVIGILCLVLGIGLLVTAGNLHSRTRQFVAKARTAPGIVVDLARSTSSDYRTTGRQTTYAPVVEFTTDSGEKDTFTSSSSSYPPAFRKGESVEVLYDPANPYDARINTFGTLGLASVIVGGLGAVFSFLGLGIGFYGWWRQHLEADLKANGRVITADVQGVAPNLSVSVNGRSPFQILAQWQDPATSEIHVFHSENIWFDPTEYLDRKILTVYVDKNNLKKYYVDTSFLPKLAG